MLAICQQVSMQRRLNKPVRLETMYSRKHVRRGNSPQLPRAHIPHVSPHRLPNRVILL